MDYTKNIYAEAFNKELGRTTPEYLSQFCLEQMLMFDATRQSALIIVRQYLKKRELVQKIEVVLPILIEDENVRNEVFEKVERTSIKIKRENQN
jgi:hypothetical protein